MLKWWLCCLRKTALNQWGVIFNSLGDILSRMKTWTGICDCSRLKRGGHLWLCVAQCHTVNSNYHQPGVSFCKPETYKFIDLQSKEIANWGKWKNNRGKLLAWSQQRKKSPILRKPLFEKDKNRAISFMQKCCIVFQSNIATLNAAVAELLPGIFSDRAHFTGWKFIVSLKVS